MTIHCDFDGDDDNSPTVVCVHCIHEKYCWHGDLEVNIHTLMFDMQV